MTTPITAHVMVKNEEYWVGHILRPLLEVLDFVLVADCGSTDRTQAIIKEVLYPHPQKSRFFSLGALTPEENGQVRQFLTRCTQTEWAMIVDGDEYYPEGVLRKICDTDLPSRARLGFTTLQTVVWKDGQFWNADLWSKQAMFHVPSTAWSGPYPYEGPNTYHDEEGRYYYADCLGLDFHHLDRSSDDEATLHRRDGTRELPRASSGPVELPFELGPWLNPYARLGAQTR